MLAGYGTHLIRERLNYSKKKRAEAHKQDAEQERKKYADAKNKYHEPPWETPA